jgi:replicative DNA helicase Mcm
MAKSNLKHALKKIMPGIVLSSGTGSTKAGLTAAAIKDDFAGGSWSIEAGAMPLADGSGLVIDEFDKLHNDDKKQLNDALSNCQFEVHKAGFHLKLWTRCFVVALLNPKHGRFDDYAGIADQIDIPPDTLSRFDLIFIIKDVVNESEDKLVALQMAKAWTGEDTAVQGAIPVEDGQKYIALAQTIQPGYSKEVSETIVHMFLKARNKSKEGRIAVTRRYVESLFRLSKAEAQLALSSIVTLEHLDRAAKLLNASILQIGMDEAGNLDADIIAAGRSKSQRDKIMLIHSIIRDLSHNNGAASLGEVVLEAEKTGIQSDELKALIDRMKLHGEIFEPKNGLLKVI